MSIWTDRNSFLGQEREKYGKKLVPLVQLDRRIEKKEREIVFLRAFSGGKV